MTALLVLDVGQQNRWDLARDGIGSAAPIKRLFPYIA